MEIEFYYIKNRNKRVVLIPVPYKLKITKIQQSNGIIILLTIAKEYLPRQIRKLRVSFKLNIVCNRPSFIYHTSQTP